jgi:D-lactate dehydrogenase
MAGDGIDEARRFLQSTFPSAQGAFFECTEGEGERAFLHRFVTAGAAVRYCALHRPRIEGMIALDVALRRNDRDWFEKLPDDIAEAILHRLYYGHFFCHVLHQDYVVSKGHDTRELEHRMWALLDARGTEYPAEHNVGHLYNAKPALLRHYMTLDPRNCFNPGIGRSSKGLLWRR